MKILMVKMILAYVLLALLCSPLMARDILRISESLSIDMDHVQGIEHRDNLVMIYCDAYIIVCSPNEYEFSGIDFVKGYHDALLHRWNKGEFDMQNPPSDIKRKLEDLSELQEDLRSGEEPDYIRQSYFGHWLYMRDMLYARKVVIVPLEFHQKQLADKKEVMKASQSASRESEPPQPLEE